MSYKSLTFFISIFFIAAPACASAQVVISEFVYDAQGTDDKQEWVEIYNAGSASVDLTKWKINDGANHVLNVPPKNGGKGSIFLAAGGYAILADDAATFIAAYPSVANVIDTTLSLSNTGSTIMLMNDSGGVSDSVSYTKDLGGNGDGNSLQRNDAVWIPALPTPGGANATTPAAPVISDTGSASSTAQASSTSSQSAKLPAVSSYVPPPDPLLYAYAGKDRDAIAGADLEFDGQAYDKNGSWLDASTTRFSWNFGDGASGEGPKINHHFAIPGRYAVVLSIANAENADAAQLIVTVHPVEIGLGSEGDSIVLTNHSAFDLDLSHWRLSSGGADFELPAHTELLAKASAAFPKEVTKLSPDPDMALEYPNGVKAGGLSTSTPAIADAGAHSSFAPPVSAVFAATLPVAHAETDAVSVVDATDTVTDISADPATDIATDTPADIATTSAYTASAASGAGGSWYWWALAGLLALVTGAGAYFAKRGRVSGWDIEEG